jgi:hypothetical protein
MCVVLLWAMGMGGVRVSQSWRFLMEGEELGAKERGHDHLLFSAKLPENDLSFNSLLPFANLHIYFNSFLYGRQTLDEELLISTTHSHKAKVALVIRMPILFLNDS